MPVQLKKLNSLVIDGMMVQAGVLSSVALISGNTGFVEKLGKPSTKLEEF